MEHLSRRERIVSFLSGFDIQESDTGISVGVWNAEEWHELGWVSGDAVAQDPEGARIAISRIVRHHMTAKPSPIARTMEVCPVCGNKRCPRATDPALPCTGSNEPDQSGSRYTTPTPGDPK